MITRREHAELVAMKPDHAPLASTEIAGHTLTSLISPGTELNGFYRASNFPNSPGYAAVFRVERVGSDVQAFKIGDLALCIGRHQSYQRVEAHMAVKVPAGLPPAHAGFARLMAVAMSVLTTTAARPPEKVLITGLGPIGNLACQIFAGCGYEVFAADPLGWRRELLAKLSVATIIDQQPENDPRLVDQVSLAVDCSGHEAAILSACKVVRQGGEVVLIGAPWEKKTDISAHALLHEIFYRHVHLRSGLESELPLYPAPFRPISFHGNLQAALAAGGGTGARCIVISSGKA
jgi:D-arabinose 1-dehydrogenase-like Zn-dependent alcohol dehydrogenase